MLSKKQIKLINSLSHKKFRDDNKLFIAEGSKLVNDLMPYFECILQVTEPDDLKRVTQLSTPPSILALFKQRTQSDPLSFIKGIQSNLSSDIKPLLIALDSVQDPGNLGTIIRTADWFGVRQILCSHTTADIYNPKVVQSTMGALARVDVMYCDLELTLAVYKQNGWKIYGTLLDGSSIYQTQLNLTKSVVVMGNEGNGISEKIKQLISDKLLIPSFPKNEPTSESLNVAIATAITLSEFRRNS